MYLESLTFDLLISPAVMDTNQQATCLMEGQPQHVVQTTVTVCGEDDVFLCGKCKRRFVTINQFMSHKQSQCVIPTNVHVPHGHPMMQQQNRGHTYGNLGHSPHMQVSSEVVLGDQGVPISNYTNMEQYQNTVLQRPPMSMPAGPFLAPHSQMGIGKENSNTVNCFLFH